MTAALWALGLVVGPAAELPAVSAELEFRGVSQEEAICLICLYDPLSAKSRWIPVNGQADGITVRAYDSTEDKVVVTRAGKVMTLPLVRARITQSQTIPGEIKADGTANLDFKNVDQADDTDDTGKDASRVLPLAVRKLPPLDRALVEEFYRQRSENNALDVAYAWEFLQRKRKS